MGRLSVDSYFLQICHAVSQRATCDRGRSGAVIVLQQRLVSSGYVGAPVGLPHCDEVGHLLQQVIHPDGRRSEHCVRTIHAEQNALTQAAAFGIGVSGATIYCSMTPCRTCAMLLIASGIRRVVCWRRYQLAALSEELFAQAGVMIEHLEAVEMVYQSPLPP